MRDPVNILLVDDQPSKLLTYEATLADLGENLINTQSAWEALACLLKRDIAVIVLDVSMPDVDGFQLAEMIRQHPRFQELPIIFVSAVHLDDIDRLKGYAHGGVDYISAPIIPEVLRAKVKVFCTLYRKARLLESISTEMRRLSGRMLVLQDEEHRRIAREMHDGLGQDLSAAKMTVESIGISGANEKVERACGFIDNALAQVRSISFLLHPPMLDRSGLGSAIRSLVEGLSKRSGIEIYVEIEPIDFPRLSRDLETAIYRIIQEALTNVFRHSGGHKAWVTLTLRERQVAVQVRDDGKGIPERFCPTGVGVAGMTQRCREFGGELKIKNVGPGTLVEASIPVGAAISGKSASARSGV
jgi:signal transduction histidine kinase